MFASGYFAPTYFAPTYFPPGLADDGAGATGAFVGVSRKKRKTAIERAHEEARRRDLHIDDGLRLEIQQLETQIEVIQAEPVLDTAHVEAIPSTVDREIARLLHLKAEADLALLEQRLAELRLRRKRRMRLLEDVFILLLLGD